jgi:hypothetical protein
MRISPPLREQSARPLLLDVNEELDSPPPDALEAGELS